MLPNYRVNKGMTLVELLIVIAVIGVLAIAVLAALGPLEQMRKSRDSARFTDAGELYSAYERYYLSYGQYPWQNPAVSDGTVPNIFVAVNPELDYDNQDSGQLVVTSELKPSFRNVKSYIKRELFVSLDMNSHVNVCFEPESKSWRHGGMRPTRDKYNLIQSSGCNLNYGGDGTVDCFICVPEK